MSAALDIPVPGPCSYDGWATGDDVKACFGDDCEDPSLFNVVAQEASALLYEISGRVFPGRCSRTVRPCVNNCGCWGGWATGFGPWYWTTAAFGIAPSGWSWAWRSECSANECGCGTTSKVRLAGYPVIEITEVKIDGVVLPPTDSNGNPNYRLDGHRDLIRMDDPTNPTNPRLWPACQNMSLDDTEAGTFAVSYTWGIDPPPLAKSAAVELAVELFKGCSNQACQIPPNAIRIQRQGVTIERNVLLAFTDSSKPTGLVALDLFLAANYGPKMGRRPAVWSPDVQRYAQKVG